MPNIIKEKLVKSKEKLKEKAKNFKPKEVISKLRDKGRTGSRRLSWLLLGIFLYFYFEWWAWTLKFQDMNVNCKIFQECSSNYSSLYFVGLSFICCCTVYIQVFSKHPEKYGLPSICQVSCLVSHCHFIWFS